MERAGYYKQCFSEFATEATYCPNLIAQVLSGSGTKGIGETHKVVTAPMLKYLSPKLIYIFETDANNVRADSPLSGATMNADCHSFTEVKVSLWQRRTTV